MAQRQGVTNHTAEEGEILLFYGHSANKPYREFSNFYLHRKPFKFDLPRYAQQEGLPTYVWCEFSEKAIMATKAALMGDIEMFNEIERATNPATCKQCGRKVKNFDEALWQKHLEDLAFEVVVQKFRAESALTALLLKTGNRIIAEAAPGDAIWGIGMPSSDPDAQDPSRWRGRNILGAALMRARSTLRGDDAEAATASDTAAPTAVEKDVSATAGGAQGSAASVAVEKEDTAKGKRRWKKPAAGSEECTETSSCTAPDAGSSAARASPADDEPQATDRAT